MPEAWHVREYQRQKLIEELVAEALETAEKVRSRGQPCPDLFFLDAVMGLLCYRRLEVDFSLTGNWNLIHVAEDWVQKAVFDKIDKFARTNAEQRLICANLIQKLLDLALAPIYNEARREETEQPEKVFGAPAMAEVSWNNVLGP